MCLSADGRHLYVVESSPPLISRIEIGPDGSAGSREILVELPRQVPDGVALDVDSNLYISLYNPNIIYRLTPEGILETLYDDWEQLMLVAPTNVAFGGKDMRTLIIASLCGSSVHTARMDVVGLRVRYPRMLL
jgi:gluconolactonase